MKGELTPYDTGARAEPKVWGKRHIEDDGDYGKVDFNADDDYTIATLHIERGEDGSYTLSGNANEALKVDIDFNVLSEEEPVIIAPSAALKAKVQEVIANLSTETERIGAEVYWQQGQALVLVPGETGYRKQQAIMVDEPGSTLSGLGWKSDRDYSGINSAIVKGWATGVRDTRIG